jgi:hypothetical protein
VSIKDLHGTPPTAAYAKQWLNNNREGGHIGKTPTFANAGKFSFTKWPCGKYCLAGFNGGLWQACPNENSGLTQCAEATEACLEFDVTEVPCNIRDDANNCLWNSGKNQCCGKVDCFTDKEEKDKKDDTPKPFSPTQDGTTRDFDGGQFQVMCGKAYWTGNLIKHNAPDPEACQKVCAANPKCQGATFHFKASQCYNFWEWEGQPSGPPNANEKGDWVTFRPSQSAEFWEPARISAVDAWSHPTIRVCNLSSMVMVQSSSTSFPLLVATFATTLTYSWLSLFFATS